MASEAMQRAQAAALRQRAEARLSAQQSEANAPQAGADTQRLLHELQVHQVELEMQNEELRQTREQLEAGLERYTDLYDFAPVGYFTLDRDGVIGQVNLAGASLLGVERRRLTGQRFERYVFGDDRPAFTICRQQAAAQLGRAMCEVTLQPAGGTPRVVHLEAAVVGEEPACRLAVIDITDRKQMEAEVRRLNAGLEQRVATRTVQLLAQSAELSAQSAALRAANAELEQASRLKNEFLANMSHEFRTPLTAILGLAEALQKGVYGAQSEKQARMLQIIRQSGEHLLALITDILDLAKIEADRLELQFEAVAVEDICRICLHVIQPMTEKKRLAVRFQRDLDTNLILADARRLKQMLMNLLGNAVKFTPAGGQVGLEVQGNVAEGIIRFIIWDTGIGITSEQQRLLFQPFVQVDGGLARKYEGTGLGLVLTRRLAQMHGGTVTAESAGADRGSRFTLTLPWPAIEPPAAQPASALPANLLLPSGRAPLILLVDDDEATLTAIGDYLQSLAATVLIARNGQEALTLALSAPPDLILMDCQMPVLNGLDAARRLRATPELAEVPVIALTALAMPGDRERCLEAGADDYLSKPVTLGELARAVVRQWARQPR